MSHILVATDLSTRADRAVGRAFRLAKRHGVPLTVVSVIDGDLPERLATPLVAEAQALLEEFCGIQQGEDEVTWDAKVVTGDVTAEVHDMASALEAGLIVLGLHRHRAILDGFRETTLERLVRTASTPVLLVADPPDHPYERAVAAIDASPAATAALAAARRWMPDAEITPFHAVYTGLGRSSARDPEDIMSKALLREVRASLQEWAARDGLPEGVAPPEVIEGALGAVLDAEVAARSAQLVILGAHARHGIVHRMLGGFARDVVHEPPCDVLIGFPS